MRELTKNEMKEVNGGLAPLVGLAAAAAGHFMVRSFAGWVVSRVSTVAAVYGAAEYISQK